LLVLKIFVHLNKQTNINTMENLFIYLLAGLAVIFLLLSLETIVNDFKYIAKDIRQAIKPGKISMNGNSYKPNQKKQPNQSINQ
jgi:hypothetical protein